MIVTVRRADGQIDPPAIADDLSTITDDEGDPALVLFSIAGTTVIKRAVLSSLLVEFDNGH